jgi:hypothetical protein
MPSIKLSKDAKWEQAKSRSIHMRKMQKKNPGFTQEVLKTAWI